MFCYNFAVLSMVRGSAVFITNNSTLTFSILYQYRCFYRGKSLNQLKGMFTVVDKSAVHMEQNLPCTPFEISPFIDILSEA